MFMTTHYTHSLKKNNIIQYVRHNLLIKNDRITVTVQQKLENSPLHCLYKADVKFAYYIT